MWCTTTPDCSARFERDGFVEETVAEDIDMLLQGDAESLEESSNALALTYGFALAIVFLVLVAQFESLTSALVVLLTVPFALAAAVFALFLSLPPDETNERPDARAPKPVALRRRLHKNVL